MRFIETMRFADLAVGLGWLLFGAGSLLMGVHNGFWLQGSDIADRLAADTRSAMWLQGTGILILWVGIVRQWTIQQRINRIAMANGDRD